MPAPCVLLNCLQSAALLSGLEKRKALVRDPALVANSDASLRKCIAAHEALVSAEMVCLSQRFTTTRQGNHSLTHLLPTGTQAPFGGSFRIQAIAGEEQAGLGASSLDPGGRAPPERSAACADLSCSHAGEAAFLPSRPDPTDSRSGPGT
jgi:hypothetical protein